MSKNFIATYVFSATCLCLIVLFFVKLPINPYPDFDNAMRYTRAEVCQSDLQTCQSTSDYTEINLPHFTTPTREPGLRSVTYRLYFDRLNTSSDLQGVFLPKYSDFPNLVLNGERVSPFGNVYDRKNGQLPRLWSRPFYTNFSPNFVKPKDNILEIELSAHNYGRLSLYPVYIGDSFRLRIAHQFRQVLRMGFQRLFFAMTITVGAIFLGLWFIRRHEKEYLWLSLANLSAVVFCLHYLFPDLPVPDHLRTVVWAIAVQAYIYAFYHYSLCIIGMTIKPLTRLFSVFCLLTSFALLLVPTEYLADALALYFGLTGLWALLVPALFLKYRPQAKLVNGLHFVVFIIVLACGAVDYLYYFWAPKRIPFQLAHFAPLLMFVAASALIALRLVVSVNAMERLQLSMQKTIEEKAGEISQYEKQKAVNAERQRLMLDLHDGVGGQLVNTIAYMNQTAKVDHVVKTSLEDALRDIALIIDSLEGNDSLDMLLGALRNRLEPLMQPGNIDLIWQVHDTPFLGEEAASENLNVIRLVQEAVTNAVKHANPKTITIRSDERAIHIIDDGQGFDIDKVAKKSGTNSGIGLRGIRRRTEELGATCDIKTGPDGTHIHLFWPEDKAL